MKSPLLFLVFIMGSVLALHVDDGCEAKSKWEIGYLWNEIQIGVWVPPGNASNILTVEVEFEGQIYPLTFDNIELYHNGIFVERIRNGDRKLVRHEIPSRISEGWADFLLTIDSHYGIQASTGRPLLPSNSTVDFMPKSLKIMGSNVTINCRSEFKMWKISGNLITLPLNDPKTNWLSFFSTEKFTPTIVLEMREIPLGWNDGNLTTIPTELHALPAFTEHHMVIKCDETEEKICSVKIGEHWKVAEELRLGELPKSVSIKGITDESFFVFLHIEAPISPDKHEVPTQNENSSAKCKLAIALTVVLALILLAVPVIVLVVSKKLMRFPMERRGREDKTDSLEKGKRSSGSSIDSGISHEAVPFSSDV